MKTDHNMIELRVNSLKTAEFHYMGTLFFCFLIGRFQRCLQYYNI